MAIQFVHAGPHVLVQLPIRIWGMDAQGRPFTQQASTVSIGPEEACISGMHSAVSLDEILGLSCDGRKGRFRVVWVGENGSPLAGQIAVRGLDKVRNIWAVNIVPSAVAGAVERRFAPRYRCEGAASIWQEGMQYPINAAVSDISTAGCYAELMNPLPVGTRVSLLLTIPGSALRAMAQVCTSHRAVGMGLKFETISSGDVAILQHLIADLAAKEGSSK